MARTLHRASALRKAAFLTILVDLVGGGLLTASVGAGSTEQAGPAASGVSVIVRAQQGRERLAEAAAERLGGRIGRRLSIINGFVATLPASARQALYADRAVLSVSPDRRLHPDSASVSTSYVPGSDGYSMRAVTQGTGARAWWNAGYAGRGVDVALIDSGVSPVHGLSDPGKIVYGPDLSLESQAPNLTELDTYGHGTFMAGLIAGRDVTSGYYSAPASTYLGMAPDTRIVSLKVATADGGTDVSQVIAAVDWVVQHRSDNGLNIRVINVSYGTNSLQSYRTDPLAYAFEQAWKKGLVVVAAAGNTGYQRGRGAPGLADPAYDPYVIGVAAADTMGTSALNDDSVASFSASSSGCGSCKNPDITVPGAHLQGLRVANSFVDANHPEGYLDPRYFRGSGTSEAAAITSGAVALMLQMYRKMYRKLTPDSVKRYLTNYAFKLPGFDTQAQGAGEIQLGAMLAKGSPPTSTQKFTNASGIGLVESARGSDHLTRDNVTLTGEKDIFGATLSTPALAKAEAAGSSWSGGVWNGSSWSGSSWSGNSWSGNSWSGSSWSGSSWSGSSWSGNSWSGNSWSGNSWSGNSWSGSSWSGSSWSGGSWASAYWG